jgi:hypothetical protein
VDCREPLARAAYAKYECNHVYQTPSGGLGCHAPPDFVLPVTCARLARDPISLSGQASWLAGQLARILKNALPGGGW